ncbi:Aste57867_25096 [Aphanomyces stellatus]|uniref:Aste57867_25096 protein n=1 Tax=Aphanomyces stellatus TaxID=120398 RepID=A0A485LT46_9STRA|nr:hypothetical protein As57867_025018 [Aphanomyces stellatus]VFU01727.1 Aste57867_25096 [Aphanomyces stellatus]
MPTTRPQYGLYMAPGSHLATTTAIALPALLTWECLLKPPLLPHVTIWLLHHARMAVGIYSGHVVVRQGRQIYITKAPCATENVVRHWAGMFLESSSPPLVSCNGAPVPALVRVDSPDGAALVRDVEALAQPPRDGRAVAVDDDDDDGRSLLRIGWTSKPRRMRDAGIHLVLAELRLWRGSLSLDVLSTWKLREVTFGHPHAPALAAYWRFQHHGLTRIQVDASGGGHLLQGVGFDEMHWSPLFPLQIETDEVVQVHLHHAPTSSSYGMDGRQAFVVEVVPVPSAPPPPKAHTHVVLVLDVLGLTGHDLARAVLALAQFITALSETVQLALLTTLDSTNLILLPWRTMDNVGKRDSTKRVKTVYAKPAASCTSLATVLDAAIDIVASECHHTASWSSFWAAAIVVITNAPFPRPSTLACLQPIQHVTTLAIVNLQHGASVCTADGGGTESSVAASPSRWNAIEYAHALRDLEWVVSDIVFRLAHLVCHSLQLHLVAVGDICLALDKPLAALATMHTTTDTTDEYLWDIGLLSASDRVQLTGTCAWTAATQQSIDVHVRYRVCGAILSTRTAVASYDTTIRRHNRTRLGLARPPYTFVRDLAQQAGQESASSLDFVGCRIDAARVDRLLHKRHAYLEQANDLETSDAQKHFEQLRAQKDRFVQAFQMLVDDVAVVDHAADVVVVADETARLLRPAVASPKKAPPVFVYDEPPDETTSPHTPAGPQEWVEPLALLQAKTRVEDADAEWDESAKGLRLVDDDLKRAHVFIMAAEIDAQLELWLHRLHETRRMRDATAPLFAAHACGGKRILAAKMQANRTKRTEADVVELKQIMPALEARVAARAATDAAALDRLKPSVQAEYDAWLQVQLAYVHARFVDVLKDKPIPSALLPFATYVVVCDDGAPAVRNVLHAMLFALRTLRCDGHANDAVCPAVQSHKYPLWLDDEQLVKLHEEMEGVAEMVAEQKTIQDEAWQACAQVLFVTHPTCCMESIGRRVQDATARGKPVLHVHLGLDSMSPSHHHLPPPIHAARVDLDRFACECCRRRTPDELLEAPCHACSYFRVDDPDLRALILDVAAVLNVPTVPQATPSPLLWKGHVPPPLFQRRKSAAERRWLAHKATHAERTDDRTTQLAMYHTHVFDRLAEDASDVADVAHAIARTRHVRSTAADAITTDYELGLIGQRVRLAAAQAKRRWLQEHLDGLEADIEGHIHRTMEAAKDDLQLYRQGLVVLPLLAKAYASVNDAHYVAMQDMAIKAADIWLDTQLVEMEQAAHATVDACLADLECQGQRIREALLAAVPSAADTLFALCNVQTFAPSASHSSYDHEWLARAVADLQQHEKHCLDRIEAGFVLAKDLESSRTLAASGQHAKASFVAAYTVSSTHDASSTLYPMPHELLGDVAFTSREVLDIPEAWESLHVMLARVDDQVRDRDVKHFVGQCVTRFTMTYVARCQHAWVAQCHDVLARVAAGLLAATDDLHRVTPPRHDSERLYRAAMDDLAACQHRLRCWHDTQRRTAQVAAAMHAGMLHLREILTLQTKVEATARQHNLKATKTLWDALATYQSECFASAFEAATSVEQQLERLAADGNLLDAQLERCAAAVDAKRAAWLAALWTHLRVSGTVQKWHNGLYTLLHTIVALECKRQKTLQRDLDAATGVVELSADEFVDSFLIRSSIFRLERQKQARLVQLSGNHVRLLERLLRHESERLTMTVEEAARKQRLNDLLAHRCRFLDATHAQTAALETPKTHHVFGLLLRRLKDGSDAGWQRFTVQTAAFAEENWMVQHRKNVVLALDDLLVDAQATHAADNESMAQMQDEQDAMAADIESSWTPSAMPKPLDAVHLMLLLNARASATWARHVNVQRTVLHETMYMKRADKLEWFKIDPLAPEFATARVGYLGAEGDLICNRLEIKRADADAELAKDRCQQYMLTTMDDKAPVFAAFNPDPTLFDVAVIGQWTAAISLCVTRRRHVELLLRRETLTHDLRELNLNCHEYLLGGDLKSKDLVKIYGRPKRISSDAFADRLRFFVLAVGAAKYIKRFYLHREAIRMKKEFHVASRVIICNAERQRQLLTCVSQSTDATSDDLHAAIMVLATPDAVRSSVLLQAVVAMVVSITDAPSHDEILPRLASSLALNQALGRPLIAMFACGPARRALHDHLVASFLQQEHRPLHVDADTVQLVPSRSSGSIKVTWRNRSPTDDLHSVALGHWCPSTRSWVWQSLLCPAMERHTFTSLPTAACVYVVHVVSFAPNQHTSFVQDTWITSV